MELVSIFTMGTPVIFSAEEKTSPTLSIFGNKSQKGVFCMSATVRSIDKKGAWFSYKTHRLGQGREAAREELKNKPAMLDEIEGLVLKAYQDKFAQGLTSKAPVHSEIEELVEV